MTGGGEGVALSLPHPGEHTRGVIDAPAVVFYGDFDCTFCARTAQLLEPMVERGLLRLTFRHFPITSAHGRAEAAHRAAEAAAEQGAFWHFYEVMYANGGRLEDPDLWRYAQAAGLDLERFDRDRRADATWERIRDQFKSAVRGGVSGAPIVGVVVGQRLELRPGPRSSDEVDQLLASAS